jgi:PBP4 family serine-type D-alanyl-D-alanine carboxypeptidase
MDHVEVQVTAKTLPRPSRPRLTYNIETGSDGAGHPRVIVTIGGTLGKDGAVMYPLFTRERTATAAHALRVALQAHGVAIEQDYKIAELGDFIGDVTAAGSLPIELARHESARLADIIARVNKWSINWLADRVIITAAALAKRQPPSMALALAAMYDWLVRHPRLTDGELYVDTGSGLSYRTRISAHELVSIVRSAAGYGPDSDPTLSHAWLDSLSIAGTDGTLASRFRSGDLRGRLRGKTGTLSTAIALSGVLDFDPARPLAFALVTNGQTPLSKRQVRQAHEQLIGLLRRYLATTQRTPAAAPAPVAAPIPAPPASPGDPEPASPGDPEPANIEDVEIDPALDAESAGQR